MMRRHVAISFLVLVAVAGCGEVQGGADGGGGTGGSGGGDFTLTLASPSVLVRQGQAATVAVTAAAQGGFAQPVVVSASGLPAGVTADALTIPAGTPSAMLTLHASGSAAQGGPTMVTVTGTAGSRSHSSALGVLVGGPSGTLDTSFGSGGKFTTNLGGATVGRGLVIQPDGKIVITGGNASQAIMVRLLPDGMLDSGFGSGGKLSTGIGSFSETIVAAVQSDGKIVAAGGGAAASNNYNLALFRYSNSGALDGAFGSSGTVLTDLGGAYDEAHAVLVQPDGKIVAAGVNFDTMNPTQFWVLRYDTSGSLDATFGVGGKQMTSIGSASSYAETALLQSDGKIVLVGNGHPGSNYDFAIVRYTATGALDSSFGTLGIVTTDVNGDDLGVGAALLPDGRIVVAGTSTCGSSTCASLARYNINGSLDLTFAGGTGKIATSLAFGSNAPGGLVRQPDGALVLVGTVPVPSATAPSFALARFGADGGVDSTFGTAGVATVDFGFSNVVQDGAFGVAIDAYGRIVVSGAVGPGGSQVVAVARLWP